MSTLIGRGCLWSSACCLGFALTVANPPSLVAGAGNGWSVATPPAVPRLSDHTATRMPDSRVLVVGGLMPGDFSKGAYASAELYDAFTGRWSSAGSLAIARQYPVATLLADGRVLVTGGYVATIRAVNPASLPAAAEVYDPRRGAWSSAGRMTTGRLGHTATLLADGRVLVTGGLVPSINDSGQSVLAPTAASELFDPATDTWSAAGELPIPRSEHTATLLGDGTVLVTGGRDGQIGQSFHDAALFVPRTATWHPVAHLMVTRRAGHTASLLTDGTVLLAGGSTQEDHGGGGVPTDSAEIYQPATQSWTAVSSMLFARLAHTATVLPDGRVFVVGGVDSQIVGSGAVRPLRSAEIYDPPTRSWSATDVPESPPETSRYRDMRVWMLGGYHTATLIGPPGCSRCARVLVLGGDSAAGSAQLFDPAMVGAAPSVSGTSSSFQVLPVVGAVAAAVVATTLALVRRMRRARRTAFRGPPFR